MPHLTLYASDKIGRSCQATRTASFMLSDIKRSQARPCVLYLYLSPQVRISFIWR